MDSSGWDKVNAWAKKPIPKKKDSDKSSDKSETKHVSESYFTDMMYSDTVTEFDIVMAVADLVLEYNEILYDEFYDAAYADDEKFLEQFEEPDEVQEAVPGLWEDYLGQHMPDYDPKTHTVSDKHGTRKQAPWPKATSKEMNRRNAFLKRHKFDPKTGTIEIDEIDPATGQKMRVPVEFNIEGKDDMKTSSAHFSGSPDLPMSPRVSMTLGGTGLTQKAAKVEPILGHETAHVNQRNMVRKLSRQFPHHRKIDDLLAAASRARAKGDEAEAQRYTDAADEYYGDNLDAVRAETAAIRKRLSVTSGEQVLDSPTMDRLHQQDTEYQRATTNSQKYSRFLNSHDILPDELHADDYGEELASRYTRGRRTGAESVKTAGDPKERAKHLKDLRAQIYYGQRRTIDKTSSPMSRYHDAVEEIGKNPKIIRLDVYTSELEHPTMGFDREDLKAKIAELKADPEVQELLAKRDALREEYEQVPSDKRNYVDRTERVPNPDPRYVDVDLSTISDDELIDRFDPTMRSNEKRVEIAKQVAAEKAAKDLENQRYQRKRSRETLQAQLDSGKLTPQQAKKARQKIASIDAFERKLQGAASGTQGTPTKQSTEKKGSMTVDDQKEPKTTKVPSAPQSTTPTQQQTPKTPKKSEEPKTPEEPKPETEYFYFM
jgi:hypothetical protein